jgi:2-oxoglutarate ferredoxin oxidoreductase subunit beta
MEVLDEKGLKEKTIGVSPVGCSVFAYDYMDIDMHEAAHGRATAVATGISRVLPDHLVFTIQGDGDLAAIGTAETIHMCNRGENIVIFFVNNAIYGMTGGQMAPTTLGGQVTSSSPDGRNLATMGYPIKISDMVAMLPGTHFVTRVALNNPQNSKKTKKAIEKAFEYAIAKKGTSLVEIVGNCPSGWKMTTLESYEWWEENMIPYYPLGVIKDNGVLVEKKDGGK